MDQLYADWQDRVQPYVEHCAQWLLLEKPDAQAGRGVGLAALLAAKRLKAFERETDRVAASITAYEAEVDELLALFRLQEGLREMGRHHFWDVLHTYHPSPAKLAKAHEAAPPVVSERGVPEDEQVTAARRRLNALRPQD